MFRIPAFFMALLACLTVTAQRTIRGRVVNEQTGAGIGGCSVFITNTSKGTVADNAGYFELQDIPAGKHELVISSIGYETNVFPFQETSLPLQLRIEMRIRVKELEAVTVEPSVEEGWDKWGSTFMKNFVGTTPNASQCRIKNEKAIRFRFYKKSNRLVAYCDEPVLLENKALGYVINYQLENFEVRFNEQSVTYMGYAFFKEAGKQDHDPKAKWVRNREKAYQGSIMHFMRSMYNNSILQEGFEVRRMQRVVNAEKERVRKIFGASQRMRKDSATGRIMIDYNLPKDSMDYYQLVMRQENHRDIIGAHLLAADSLLITAKDGFKFLHFEDFIYVTFKNAMEDDAYLLNQHPARKATFQRSYVVLLEDKIIGLDGSGNYFDPQHFLTSAYWGWSEKMANSLPLDYRPAK